MEIIGKTLLANGIFGVIATFLLYLILKPALESWIKTASDQIVEGMKIDHALIAMRAERSALAVINLQTVIEELESELDNTKFPAGTDAFQFILNSFHSKYRKKFQRIRAVFEISNDVLSMYSLEYDSLLHPNRLKQLFAKEDIKKPTDAKRVYKKIWLTVLEGMMSVLRATSSSSFWEPKNYGGRANRWASYEGKRIGKFLIEFAQKSQTMAVFRLLIERKGAQDEFWSKEPKAFAESRGDKFYIEKINDTNNNDSVKDG